MRTYPENSKELEKKHGFSFPIDKQKLEIIHDNLILRHDLAFLFLKSRTLNSLSQQNKFKNEVFLDSFLDKRFDSNDRLKIYNTIKDKIPLPVKEDEKLFLYYLLLLIGFLFPWLIYLIVTSLKDFFMLFSLTNPKLFVFLFLAGTLITASIDYFFGDFFKKKPSVDTGALTIRDFICNIISKNRKDIKENFELIFKNDIDSFNQ